MANIDLTQLTDKSHGVAAIETYRGYEIVDRDEFVVILRDGGVAQPAHTLEQAKANIDELVQARYQANLKKMGRHVNNPNDLI